MSNVDNVNPYSPENLPPQGTPEYEAMMKQYYGQDYEKGLRASFGKRFGASIIDAIIALIVLVIAWAATGILGEYIETFMSFFKANGDMAYIEQQKLVMQEIAKKMIPISLVVSVIFMTLDIVLQSSIGKLALGLKVRDLERKAPTMIQLLTRTFVKTGISTLFNVILLVTSISVIETIGGWISSLIYLVSLITIAVMRQGVHDIAAKTAVYHKDDFVN